MGSTIEDAAVAPQELLEEDVRARFRGMMQEDGRSLSRIAQETAVSYSTLSAWANGTYKGDNARVTRDVHAYLNTRDARQQVRAQIPDAPGYVGIKTASQIFDLLVHAQTLPDLVLITGGPGVGKTFAIKQYQRNAANVWLLTAESWMGTPAAVMKKIALALGIRIVPSTLELRTAIERTLQHSRGLLVIDEAQNLTMEILDQVRMLHDSAEVGIALVGDQRLSERFASATRSQQYAQLYSRIGARLNRQRPLREDIAAMLDAWHIEDEQTRKLVTGLALRPGALRSMTKILRLAGGMASVHGREEPTIDEIEAAAKNLGGDITGAQA